MENTQQLSQREIEAINQLMKRKSEIVLQPRKNGYAILEAKKNTVLLPEDKNTTE